MVNSILTGQKPGVILGGLGAASAILMLIFKDTILGFVASMQVSANDMVRIGDWITMPRYGADGDVIQISLTTVKIRNFDKTITTIPPYSLVSDSFQNWRGMVDAGGRSQYVVAVRISHRIYLIMLQQRQNISIWNYTRIFPIRWLPPLVKLRRCHKESLLFVAVAEISYIIMPRVLKICFELNYNFYLCGIKYRSRY